MFVSLRIEEFSISEFRGICGFEKNILLYYVCELGNITRYPTSLARLRSLQMHYESEITLEYSTHTYECIKGTGGDIDFLAYFNIRSQFDLSVDRG